MSVVSALKPPPSPRPFRRPLIPHGAYYLCNPLALNAGLPASDQGGLGERQGRGGALGKAHQGAERPAGHDGCSQVGWLVGGPPSQDDPKSFASNSRITHDGACGGPLPAGRSCLPCGSNPRTLRWSWPTWKGCLRCHLLCLCAAARVAPLTLSSLLAACAVPCAACCAICGAWCAT